MKFIYDVHIDKIELSIHIKNTFRRKKMKKMFLDENNKIHKQLYIAIFSVLVFFTALFSSQNYLQADEPGRFGEKPTEEQIKSKLSLAVTEGKLTQEEADSKLEAILSGDIKRNKPGRFGNK